MRWALRGRTAPAWLVETAPPLTVLRWPWHRKKPPTIADTIREKIAAGQLPREDYVKLWIGYGQGRRCAACEHRILRSQVKHEMQFADGRVISMHFGCVGLYEAERRRRG